MGVHKCIWAACNVLEGTMNAERYIKFLEQHCHNQLLEWPCQPQEGTLFRLLFFGSGLRFPSPLALMIVWSSSAVGHLLISSSLFKPCSLSLSLLQYWTCYIVFLLPCLYGLFFCQCFCLLLCFWIIWTTIKKCTWIYLVFLESFRDKHMHPSRQRLFQGWPCVF